MKVFTGLIIIGIIFTSSCVDLPNDFDLPSWDVDLNIPLTERTYELEEIIKLDSNISINKVGDDYLYTLNSEEYERTFQLSDFIDGQFDGIYDEDFKIPVQTADTSIYVSFSNGTKIDSAYLTNGQITLIASNNSSENVKFILTFVELQDDNSNPLIMEVDMLGSQQNKIVSADMSNYSYSSSDREKILIRGEMFSDNPSADEVSFNFEFSDSKFSYIKGNLPPQRLDDMNEYVELPLTDDILEMRNSIFLGNAKLELSAEYVSKYENQEIFEIQFDSLKINGKRNTGLDMPLTDNFGNDNLGKITFTKGSFYKLFDNSNSNISEFLSFLPDNLHIFSPVIMNPEDKNGVITDEDKIDIKVKFNAKSALRIDTLEYTHIEEFDIGDDTTHIKNSKHITLTFLVTNTIPTREEVVAKFVDENGTVLFTKDLEIPGGKITESGKMDLTPVKSETEFELDEIEIGHLLNTKDIEIDMILMTTDEDKFAVFGPKQWVKIKAYATIKYNIEDL